MKITVLDDEKYIARKIAHFLKEVPFVNEIKEFECNLPAIKSANVNQPDLLIINLDTEGVCGFELTQQFNFSPSIALIFCGSDVNHAFKAFDFGAIDFLTKPLKKKRFLFAMEKFWKIS